jgi:hypothetical protein
VQYKTTDFYSPAHDRGRCRAGAVVLATGGCAFGERILGATRSKVQSDVISVDSVLAG